jgi:acyl-CoA synthetase (AMP-forming)/AMP-acid ligase II
MGLPFPGVDVEVQDPDSGAECPPETVGEICVRGDNVGPGYVRGGTGARGSSDPWAEGLQRRGPWLRTGDLGSADTEGYVTFRGVRKPMFTRNGFNIYPRELEAAVLELPGVQRVTVHAVPDPVREHDIALEVVGAVTEEEVKRWCAERLSAYKQPSTVIVSG